MERIVRPARTAAHASCATRFASTAAAALVVALAIVAAVASNPVAAFAEETPCSPCVPTSEQLAAYAADGTLDERIAFAERLGNDQPDPGLIQRAVARERAADGASPLAVPSAYESGMATEGDAHVLAIRVSFTDYDSFDEGDSLEALQSIIGPEAPGEAPEPSAGPHPYESLNAYYERSSYGRLSITGEVFDYQAPHERSYYDLGIDQLFIDALDHLDAQGVDLSKFDANDDGRIDAVYLRFAGPDTGWGTLWWSSESTCMRDDAVWDGVKLWNTVLLAVPSNTAWGAQTIIHETGHVLGLPDYYSYASQQSSSDERSGILTFDMMMDNMGDHNGFTKWLLGWLDDADITRVIADDGGIVVKQGQTEIERVEAVEGAASIERTLEAFTSDNATDTGGIIVASNEDGGLFSSYYVLQYDRFAGNQSVQYGWSDAANNLPSGLRVFRVQAELSDDGSSFRRLNTLGTVHDQLIELVDPDMDDPHVNDVLRVPSSAVSSSYGCMLFAGDAVTPTTYPSTNFFENRNLGFTGFTFSVSASEDDRGTVSIEYSNADAPDPHLELKLTPRFDSVSPIGELVFDASTAPLRSSDSELFPHIAIDGVAHPLTTLTVSGTTVSVPCLLNAGSIGAASSCEIVFPAGQFVVAKTSAGVVLSPEIRIPLKPRADLAPVEQAGFYEGTGHLYSITALSDVFACDDGSRCFLQLVDDMLKLHTMRADDPSRLTTTDIGANPAPPLSEHLVLSAVPLSSGEVFLAAVDETTGDGTAYWIDRVSGAVANSCAIEGALGASFAAEGRDAVMAFASPLHPDMLLCLLSPQSDGTAQRSFGSTKAEVAVASSPSSFMFGFRDNETGEATEALAFSAAALVEALRSGAPDIQNAETLPNACAPERAEARMPLPADRMLVAAQATDDGYHLLLSVEQRQTDAASNHLIVRYDRRGVEQARGTMAQADGTSYRRIHVGEHGTVALVATTLMSRYSFTKNDTLFCDENLQPLCMLTTASAQSGLWLGDGRWIGVGTQVEGAAGQKGSPVEPVSAEALETDGFDPSTRAYYAVTAVLDKAPEKPGPGPGPEPGPGPQPEPGPEPQPEPGPEPGPGPQPIVPPEKPEPQPDVPVEPDAPAPPTPTGGAKPLPGSGRALAIAATGDDAGALALGALLASAIAAGSCAVAQALRRRYL